MTEVPTRCAHTHSFDCRDKWLLAEKKGTLVIHISEERCGRLFRRRLEAGRMMFLLFFKDINL